MDELTEFEQQLSDVRAQIKATGTSQSSEVDELRVLETELADLVAELRKCADPAPKVSVSEEPLKESKSKSFNENQKVKEDPECTVRDMGSHEECDLGSLSPLPTKQLIPDKPAKPAPVEIPISQPNPQKRPQSSVTPSKWRKNTHNSTLASRTAPPRPGKVAKQQPKPRRHFAKESKP